MFRRYQDTSCRTNCECEFSFLAGRISAIRFQSPVLLDLQGEGRLISCARKKKFEHVAISRLPGRWGSLDFNKKVLLFLLRLLLRIRAASPRFLPPTCRHHGHQYSPRPRSKCQLKWRNTRARRTISPAVWRARARTLLRAQHRLWTHADPNPISSSRSRWAHMDPNIHQKEGQNRCQVECLSLNAKKTVRQHVKKYFR